MVTIKRQSWKTITALFLSILLFIPLFAPAAEAAPLLKPGSSNGDVWDLQYRLKTLDFYTQPLDGQYGPNTTAAVKRFQQEYGVPADGITGALTWRQLKKYTLNQAEMDIMAKVIYSEARGEPYKGQVAVGAVVMNRIQSSEFPNDIRGVVFQPRAFTAVDDGQYWLTPDRTAYLAAFDAVRGWDPTYESLYYFNPKTATSKWIWTRPQVVQIGNHIFAH
ncbi:spore cortex-lytic enzyme [Paenibacillus sp. JCM 10914]|uniref:spore cortex-lytic enzyme n=1 Tax=Paenibacillus sp. JCM 10914 TaxID=1236974 RepID=UPI0003CC5EAE|nr:spore cortex-lytic enzyme [Paenibacillus sp. JCM 10914]GAE09010.1 spore cortex-lytic enzyme, lytic transglycosylase SleB [Paenibacillus sp. JCM 10914]